MAENFLESTDSSGRTVVEMNDHSVGLFWFSLILAQVAVWMFARGLVQFLLAEILALALIGVVYLGTRKHVRIIIDPKRGVLVIGRRVIRLDQVKHAELGVFQARKESGPGGGPLLFYRVEVVLRGGDRVPTIRGHGQFSPEQCHRLMDLINDAAGGR